MDSFRHFLYSLGLVFIVLKLIGTITWSWWIVITPIAFSLIMFFVPILIAYISLKKLFGKSWFTYWKW